MTGKFMTIDNIPIELTGEEKNLLEVIRRTGIECPPSATTPRFQYTAHAACAW